MDLTSPAVSPDINTISNSGSSLSNVVKTVDPVSDLRVEGKQKKLWLRAAK